MVGEATARACSNIAFIKYWGNRDDDLRLPVSGSLSMNLKELFTETTVRWDLSLEQDQMELDGKAADEKVLRRVTNHLDYIRARLGIDYYAAVTSSNNFPMGTGMASSASAFAALTVAAVVAAGVDLNERELSCLARLGSGSASRSVPGGFVEWYAGSSHIDSYAESIAPPEHWDLVDVIAVVSDQHKSVGSQEGHRSAHTSDLQSARVAGAPNRIQMCKQALLQRDFETFAEVVELDSNLMHSVMMTSRPPLMYWQPATLDIMHRVRQWRSEGVQVCYTLDAGPNVHCICVRDHMETVRDQLGSVSGVTQVRVASPGGPAQIVPQTPS